MTDTAHMQQTLNAQRGNGQVAEVEPHVTHLLPGERELLAECHRHRLYLAIFGAELPVAELASNECEPGCERMIIYCAKCVEDAARVNAEAGAR